MKSQVFALIVLSVVGLSAACARDYCVSPAGDDSNPGTERQPWRTIQKVNATDFEPGDRICFQGHERFPGTILLDRADSGTSDKKLVMTSYGGGEARIDAGNDSGLVAKRCDHLVLRYLIFNGSGREEGNTKDGVVIVDAQDVEVANVSITGFRASGLQMEGVHNARISYTQGIQNGFAGISVGYNKRSSQVHLDHCSGICNPGDPSNLTNHSGNGIVVANAQDVVIEYCQAFDNGWAMPRKGNGPVGIWVWNVDRAIIQHCVSHNNRSPGDDGGGFDLDGGTNNSILQYNLSYDNDGPGYFLCQFPGAPDFKNNIIRYNISRNDGRKNNRRSGIDVYSASPNASDCQVYNNTVYNEYGPAVGFGGMVMPRVLFRNNIFICSGDVIAGEGERGRFENNIYWSADDRPITFDGHATLQAWAEASGQEKAGDTILGQCLDPKVLKPGAALPPDTRDIARVTAFRLPTDSPCLKAGMPIVDNGGRDFWGHPVPQDGRPAIGACEKP